MELFRLRWSSTGDAHHHGELREAGALLGGPGAIESLCPSRSEVTLPRWLRLITALPSWILLWAAAGLSLLGVDPGTSSLLRGGQADWVESPGWSCWVRDRHVWGLGRINETLSPAVCPAGRECSNCLVVHKCMIQFTFLKQEEQKRSKAFKATGEQGWRE